MKKLTLLLFILISTVSISQKDLKDAVYLKNGSIIYGVIIEQVPNESLKIKTSEGNILAYKIGEIDKITKEEEKKEKEETFYKYSLILEGSFGHDLKNTSMNNASFGGSLINGVSLFNHFNIGLGTGYHKYITYKYASFIPLFIDIKAYSKERNGVYLSLGYGKGFSLSSEVNGGRYLNSAFGVKFGSVNTKAFMIGIGYKTQDYSGTNLYTYKDFSERVKNFNINLSYIF